jgi:hypothetical protein
MASKYSSMRDVGREHVPLYPRGFIGLRIVQLIMSLLATGLSAYSVAGSAFGGDDFLLGVVSSIPMQQTPRLDVSRLETGPALTQHHSQS